ncbi:MAG: MGMT family protein [Candidatus Omnitrophica bacterium]|nr:MGMT family protein [Candidatus Omnitrophota bacterium]
MSSPRCSKRLKRGRLSPRLKRLPNKAWQRARMKDPRVIKLTGFERSVLRATLKIPFGETRTYAWVAGEIGKPGAVRAVGTALRKNPWPLLIPCHRVIKTGGSLGKYAGKDNGRKQELISCERALAEIFRAIE